jgi:hypothetical protein
MDSNDIRPNQLGHKPLILQFRYGFQYHIVTQGRDRDKLVRMKTEPNIQLASQLGNFREQDFNFLSGREFIKGIAHFRMGIARQKRGRDAESTDTQPMYRLDGAIKIPGIFKAKR